MRVDLDRALAANAFVKIVDYRVPISLTKRYADKPTSFR